MRTYFSLHHIQNAAFFCRNIVDEERSRIANSTAALLSATAYIEATANELLSKSLEQPDKHTGRISEVQLRHLSEMAEAVEKLPALRKYDTIIKEAGFGPVDLGKNPFQDIRRMIQLRDGLVHYKAYWLDASSDNLVKDERTLMRNDLGRFLQNKFRGGEGFGLETNNWLNRRFAGWCVESSIAFVDFVFHQFDGVPFHDHIRAELYTGSEGTNEVQRSEHEILND